MGPNWDRPAWFGLVRLGGHFGDAVGRRRELSEMGRAQMFADRCSSRSRRRPGLDPTGSRAQTNSEHCCATSCTRSIQPTSPPTSIPTQTPTPIPSRSSSAAGPRNWSRSARARKLGRRHGNGRRRPLGPQPPGGGQVVNQASEISLPVPAPPPPPEGGPQNIGARISPLSPVGGPVSGSLSAR